MEILIFIAVLLTLGSTQFSSNYPGSNFGNYPGYNGNYPEYNGNNNPGYNGNYGGYNANNLGHNGNYPGYNGYNQGYNGNNQGYNGYYPGYNGNNQGYNGNNQGYNGYYPGYNGNNQGYNGNYPGYNGNYPQMNNPGGFQHQINYSVSNFPQINSIYWRQCALESRVPDDELNRFRNRDFSNNRDNIHCFTNCIMEKMGLIHNGEILDQKILQMLSHSFPLEQISSRIATCRAQSLGFNKCESSYRFYICLLNSAGNRDIFRLAEIRK